MFKKYLLLVLILASLFSTPFTLTTKSSDNKSSTNNILTAKITKLVVSFYSNASFFYIASIEINNPTNTPITLSQPDQCGFEISIDAINDYNYGGYGHIFCPINNAPYSITYYPGITFQTYNATEGFNSNTNSLYDVPVGFYYFDLSNEVTNSSYTVFNALMVYYGNNIAKFEFNISPSNSDRLPYGTLPITEQVSLFSSSAVLGTQNQNSTFNSHLLNLLPLILLGIIAIISLISGLYIRRRNNNLRGLNTTLNNFQAGINMSPFQNSICKSCGLPLERNDKFCSNCGSRIN